jgi:hypothetical protein
MLKIPSHFSSEDWERLPPPKGRLCGLSRTTLFELVEQGEIKSAVIRKPGAQKGIRLIFMPSLAAYLETCVEEPKVKSLAKSSKIFG